jgi:hypothetical protein
VAFIELETMANKATEARVRAGYLDLARSFRWQKVHTSQAILKSSRPSGRPAKAPAPIRSLSPQPSCLRHEVPVRTVGYFKAFVTAVRSCSPLYGLARKTFGLTNRASIPSVTPCYCYRQHTAWASFLRSDDHRATELLRRWAGVCPLALFMSFDPRSLAWPRLTIAAPESV